MANKVIHIFGGGTVYWLRPHFALAAPAYGTAARALAELCRRQDKLDVKLHLTRMAGGDMESNDDVASRLKEITADPCTKIVFLTCALCDFEGRVVVPSGEEGKHGTRIKSRTVKNMVPRIDFWPAEKVVGHIRKNRKDILARAPVAACSDPEANCGFPFMIICYWALPPNFSRTPGFDILRSQAIFLRWMPLLRDFRMGRGQAV